MQSTINRRRFVAGAAATAAAASFPLGRSASARANTSGKRVAVFGAGMSGLVVAHELIERGFAVDVYEANTVFGGKARSWDVPGTASGGRKGLPAEHGFRFFPGFYQHVTDSMRRTPAPGRPANKGVLQALRSLDDLAADEDGWGLTYTESQNQTIKQLIRLRDYQRLPNPNQLANPADVVKSIQTIFGGLAKPTTLNRGLELAWFAARIGAFVTACDERRKGPWDDISWWKFMRADGRSTWFKDNLVKGTTMGLVAVKPEVCSVSSGGNIMDAFLWNLMGVDKGPLTAYALRFLDGPTTEVWIDPWVAHLESLGVRFHTGQALAGVNLGGGRVTSAKVLDKATGMQREVEADWYVSAIPVDKARPVLLTPEVLALDPSLEAVKDLKTDWMNGMQIYLKRPVKANGALFAMFDHQWTISCVLQKQLWRRDIAKEFGDGTVHDVISIDISTWDRPGMTTTKKAARDCTKEEIFREVWETLKQRAGKNDKAFTDENLHSWYLDPAIQFGSDGKVTGNDEPLTVQTVGTWKKRPKGPTAIPNLFLSGDWIQVTANVVSMEAANQGGRQTAKAVIAAAGGDPEDVFIKYAIKAPAAIEKIRLEDKRRLDKGMPNVLDAAVRGPQFKLPKF